MGALRGTRALLGFEPRLPGQARVPECWGPERAQEALKGATWWAGRPVAPVRRSSPCLALSFSHQPRGCGEVTLWPRGFMAETTVCSPSCTGLRHPGGQLHTHPAAPKWGFQLELWGPPLGRRLGWPHFPSVQEPYGVRLLL